MPQDPPERPQVEHVGVALGDNNLVLDDELLCVAQADRLGDRPQREDVAARRGGTVYTVGHPQGAFSVATHKPDPRQTVEVDHVLGVRRQHHQVAAVRQTFQEFEYQPLDGGVETGVRFVEEQRGFR